MLKTISVASCLFILFAAPVKAQSNKAIKDKDNFRKEQAIQNDITLVRKKLSTTQQQTKASLGQLALIKEKLEQRQLAIDHIDRQIGVLQASIAQSGSIIKQLTRELDTLKHQYAKSIVYSYQNRNNYDFLNFIFSAANFNDIIKRIEYLKSYRLYREQQVIAIKSTQSLLEQKIAGLHTSRREKDEALQKQQQEKLQFLAEKKEEDGIIERLKAREAELLKELENKKRADKKLGAGINAAINRKFPKTIAKSDNRSAPPIKDIEKTTPGSLPALASEGFEKSRGKLPWPVDNAVITLHFGINRIGTVQYYNPGLTFETAGGSEVKNIYDGQVYSLFYIDGSAAVIVDHGDYFVTYGNLDKVNVTKGQKILAGEIIGTVASEKDDKGKVEFVLLNFKKQNIDPEPWLKKKQSR